jgi:alpha-N-arabinofuranosidase
MDLHYYTRVYRQPVNRMGFMMFDRSSAQLSRSATQFGEPEWFVTFQQALRMEELVTRHGDIMDRYDPDRRVGLIVGEWGTWYDVEPGTNPGFLSQQNSLRDALVAGLTLNIFNKHSDRIQMANIAQTINVLQAMLLTQGEKMIMTPTYHVFEMYKVHHDATLLPINLQCDDYKVGEEKLPVLNASASKDKAGKIHVSICNLDPNRAASLDCELRGMQAKKVTGRVLTAPAINSCNTFEHPDAVSPAVFNDAKLKNESVTATLPAKSIVVLEIE